LDWKDYEYYFEILKSGDRQKLEELSQLDENFPDGKDGFINRCWIRNAVDCGHIETIKWMLGKKVDLNREDEEGFPALFRALCRVDKRYEILEILLSSGANPNIQGSIGWTPAHKAAFDNDVEALKILVKHGAEVLARIDNYTTPLEEARRSGRTREYNDAISYLETLKTEN